MTTTTATPSKRDPYAELRDAEERFEERLQQARQERARLAQQQREYAIKLRTAAQEYEALAADNADQFNSEGQPLKGTQAAKLRVVLEGGKTSRLPQMVAAADRRVEQIEAERRAFMGANAPAFARREWDRGLEAVARLRSLAPEMLALIAEAQHGYHALMSIVSSVAGSALDGRSIEVDARLDQLADLLGSLEGLKPPRIPAFVPFTDEDPTVVPTADGGWIHAHYADRAKAGLADPVQPVEHPA